MPATPSSPQPGAEVGEPDPPAASGGLARSASLLSLGNIASRILGLLREIVIVDIFGPTGLVSAFTVASQVPTMLYDFLIGGMLSAALVPVLSEYTHPERRRELTRLVGALVSLAAASLGLLVLLLWGSAPRVALLLAGGFSESDPTLLAVTARLIRWIAPATWFFSMAGLLTGILYALQRFTFPAVATAIYNLGIVVAAPLLAPHMGITSLAVGVLLGSGAQFALMAWDVRRSGLGFTLSWSHPALKRIVALYLPIAGGLVVAQLQVALDRRLASGTHPQSIAWMRSATTLQQLPLGLISVAISLAALPRLSRHHAARDVAAYRGTLGRGLRMVLILIAPALVGLALLAEPVVGLLFEHGRFTPADTEQVTRLLRIYLVGAFFAAVDFPLNYAFYARGNTLWPSLVGVFSVVIYAGVAFALLDEMGYVGLVWADTAKQAGHALVMMVLLYSVVGRLGESTLLTAARVALAAGAMAGAVHLLSGLAWPGAPGPLRDLVVLLVAGGGGLVVYAGVLGGLGVSEVSRIGAELRRGLRRRPP